MIIIRWPNCSEISNKFNESLKAIKKKIGFINSSEQILKKKTEIELALDKLG